MKNPSFTKYIMSKQIEFYKLSLNYYFKQKLIFKLNLPLFIVGLIKIYHY